MNSDEFWLDILDSQVKSSVMGCSIVGKNHLVYDNPTRSFLVNLNSTTLMIPKAPNSLKIAKPVLIFLLYIAPEKPFSFEFVVIDSQLIQRRIVLDSSRNIVSQCFYLKIPNKMILRDDWVYLSVDVGTLFGMSFDHTGFKYIESINICGTMLIRKIVAADVCYSEFSQKLVDMGKVQAKKQDISKNWALKSNSSSPNKPLDVKGSPREGIKGRVGDKGINYFGSLKSDELKPRRKYEKSVFMSPQPGKFGKFLAEISQVVKNNKATRRSNKYNVSRVSPCEMSLGKEPEDLNFFQQFSSGLLNIRHETPPFVGSRGNIFYNPVQKKYDSL